MRWRWLHQRARFFDFQHSGDIAMQKFFRSLVGGGLLCLAPWSWALSVPGPVVDAAWVQQNRSEITVLDIRNNLKSFAMAPQFEVDKKSGRKVLVELGGHIPDASLVDPKLIRVERSVGNLKIKYMLPERADFEKMARQWGAQGGRPIVIVAAGQEAVDLNDAARLYWQFKVYGEDNVAIVNGGTTAWLTEGREASVAASKPAPGNWTAKDERKDMLASSEDVEQSITNKSAQLVDARNGSQFLGLTKRDYVYGFGHIAGAKNVSSDLLVTPDGDAARLLPAATYRDIFKQSGVDPQAPIITYCNSGHLAASTWFVLHEVLGNRQTRLYDGSLHRWTLEKRPMESVARGF
jgi:thiosulfate/3-mercaptopyruvate sulfurtransferase